MCELGAEWIGESHERMNALCKEMGLQTREHRFEASLLRDGKVSRPNQWKFSQAADDAFEKFRKMDYEIVGGNARLTEALADRIGRNAFHLNSRADRIRERAGRVTVRAAGREFTGDACICTVPTRVLDGIRFDPPLPAATGEAAAQALLS